MAQVTSGEIVRSDWLRRFVCRSLLSRNRPVWIITGSTSGKKKNSETFSSLKIFQTLFAVHNLAISIAVVLIVVRRRRTHTNHVVFRNQSRGFYEEVPRVST